ncbi:hypothetical protein ACOMHN_039913 [Nucella lapillus]
MHVLTSALLWLTAVATSVQADDLSANLDLPDFKDHITVFDITTKAPVKDVKAALLSFTTIDLSFKDYLDMYGAGDGWDETFAQTPAMDTILLFLDWEIKVPGD